VARAAAEREPLGTVRWRGFVSHEQQYGRTFRAIASEVPSTEASLFVANMDFHDFADSVDHDGVFRGFPRPRH